MDKMQKTETIVTVAEDDYIVRRVIDPETGGGFLTVEDSDDGHTALILSAKVSDETLAIALLAYRVGMNRGYHRGLASEDAL